MTPDENAESGDSDGSDTNGSDNVETKEFEELSDRQKKALINAVQKAKDFMDGKTPKTK